MKVPRFVKEYSRFLEICGFDCFNAEIQKIVQVCEKGFITVDECMRLLASEKQFLIGKTDAQYKLERGL